MKIIHPLCISNIETMKLHSYYLGRVFKLRSIVQRSLIYCLLRAERKFSPKHKVAHIHDIVCTHTSTHMVTHSHAHSMQ